MIEKKIDLSAWRLKSQDWNLKKLTGIYICSGTCVLIW